MSDTISTTTPAGAVEVSDEALEDAKGGIALLLPAVQQAREAARKVHITDGISKTIKAGDGSV